LVGWEAFPLVPLETIIKRQGVFLAFSALFILLHLKEKTLNDTIFPSPRENDLSQVSYWSRLSQLSDGKKGNGLSYRYAH
jgi:hypothetical protein